MDNRKIICTITSFVLAVIIGVGILLGNEQIKLSNTESTIITTILNVKTQKETVMDKLKTEVTTKEITEVETTTSNSQKESEQEVDKVEIEATIIDGAEYSIPDCGGKFKSYTNYKLLSKTSPQWKKIQCHSDAYTDDNGLRKVGDYYCVAMGSHYSNTLGDLFEITTEGGTFQIIICDFKSDKHTDSTHRYTTANKCITEFYVDTTCLNSKAKQMGDISYADEKFSGRIIRIVKLGNYFE